MRAQSITIRGVEYVIDWGEQEPGMGTEQLAWLRGPRGGGGAVIRTEKGGLLVLGGSHTLERVPVREMRDLLRPVFGDEPPVPFQCGGVTADALDRREADPACGGYYVHEPHRNREEEEFCGYCGHHESYHEYGPAADQVPGASLPCRRCPEGVCAR